MFTRNKPIINPALSDSELAATVPAVELETLDRLATTIYVAEGKEIMRVGGYGNECFVVIDGEFAVQRDETTIIVGPGAVIGELALLTMKPRTATVTATVDSSVYVLTRSEFAAMLDECPGLARHVLGGAVRRASLAA